MNYRKYYEEMTGVQVLKGYEIHHIDLDRNNNNIKNLVMLPEDLHKSYHIALRKLEYIGNVKKIITSLIDGGNGVNDMVCTTIKEFVDVWKECNKWNDYKYYLLGIVPNVHDIRYKEEIGKNE